VFAIPLAILILVRWSRSESGAGPGL